MPRHTMLRETTSRDRRPLPERSRQDLLDHVSMHVRQAEVATLELERQLLVIDALPHRHKDERKLKAIKKSLLSFSLWIRNLPNQ